MKCKINNEPMKIIEVYRVKNGDIVASLYCYREKSSNDKDKRITHPECKGRKIIYQNGEDYDLNKQIKREENFKNLIGCWCNRNLRFQNENELLQHVEGDTHPKEFQE